MRRMLEGKPVTIVTTFAGLLSPQIPLSAWKEHMLFIDKHSEINEKELAGKLVEMGYEKNYQVEAPGQFSIRGGIVDIFDLTEENPYRIELWGDEVDSIRSFDSLSQRSIEKLSSVTIYPASEMILSDEQLCRGMEKIEKSDKKWREILTNAMFLGMVSAFLGFVFCDVANVFKGDTSGLIPVVVFGFSAIIMALCGLCSIKLKQRWMNDYALPISLIAGMAIAIPVTAWLG